MKNTVEFEIKSPSFIKRFSVTNTWTKFGRSYLAEMLGLNLHNPDSPIRSDRIKYIQFGVGSKGALTQQQNFVEEAYPAGYDPLQTNGRTYDKSLYNIQQFTTLERPIRKFGSILPYHQAQPSDQWLTELNNSYFLDPTTISNEFIVSTANSEYLYDPITKLYISEAGLALSSADNNVAYNSIVAYVNFTPFRMPTNSVLTIRWTIRFNEV